METQLFYGLKDKQLCFRLRESITADPDVEARFKGLLNTNSGEFIYRGTLKKYYSTGPLEKGAADEPLRVGAGAGVASSAGDAPFVTLSARKRVALLEGGDTTLTAKARVDVDPSSGRFVSRRAGLRVSRRLLNFTQRQDLELTAGLDLDWPSGRTVGGGRRLGGGGGGSGSAAVVHPYLSVRENNWAVHLRRGAWSLTYDL